jgi:hypothetical protein
VSEPTVGERLARIETKLDQALASHADHENRIRRLERALWMVGGFAAAGGGSLGALLTHLTGG